MDDGKRELKRCPICGSLPRYWQWNHGAIVECWCKDHRIQCEGKTLEEAVEAWERRADLEPRWIPVTERLPEKGGYYPVTCLDGGRQIDLGQWCIDEWGEGFWACDWCDADSVIAWMPLPTPYK